jgi:hypothetical protein
MSWVRHHKQTFFALLGIGATLVFCGYAIVAYESDQCHYRELRGFEQVLGKKGWCRIF